MGWQGGYHTGRVGDALLRERRRRESRMRSAPRSYSATAVRGEDEPAAGLYSETV